MAKYERRLTGDFNSLLRAIENEVINGSMSATLEDSSDYDIGDVRCAVRVFERYSWSGGNRVSMNVTLVGQGQTLFVSIITSGGSQAMFFKINTWGEESFLGRISAVIDQYADSCHG